MTDLGSRSMRLSQRYASLPWDAQIRGSGLQVCDDERMAVCSHSDHSSPGTIGTISSLSAKEIFSAISWKNDKNLTGCSHD